ncbi:Protein saf4 [Savitreella phatthalungensis]
MQGFNRYYPPDYDPAGPGKGNLNRIAGRRAPLRDGSTVRFAMPYGVVCGGCDRSIGRGTRFNAIKNKVAPANTLTVPAVEFLLKCPACAAEIRIKTNPEQARYDVVSGAREQYPRASEVVDEEDEHPLAKLEAQTSKLAQVQREHESLARLTEACDRLWGDQYASSQALRRNMRVAREAARQERLQREKLGRSSGIHMEELLPAHPADHRAASVADFQPVRKHRKPSHTKRSIFR